MKFRSTRRSSAASASACCRLSNGLRTSHLRAFPLEIADVTELDVATSREQGLGHVERDARRLDGEAGVARELRRVCGQCQDEDVMREVLPEGERTDREHLEGSVDLPQSARPRLAGSPERSGVVCKLTNGLQILDERLPALNDPSQPRHAATPRYER